MLAGHLDWNSRNLKRTTDGVWMLALSICIGIICFTISCSKAERVGNPIKGDIDESSTPNGDSSVGVTKGESEILTH